MDGAKFTIDQKVKHNQTGKEGVIGAIFLGRGGFEYRLEYVNDKGELAERYHRDMELTAS